MYRHYHAYVTIGAWCGLILALNACNNNALEVSAVGSNRGTTPFMGDGSNPSSGLIQGRDGSFYGTTAAGGQFNEGTVYRITPDGDETVLYSFAGGVSDGADPSGALIESSDGNFYGTTIGGGVGQCPGPEPVSYNGPPPPCGTVFEVTPEGGEAVLHYFSGTTDGGQPTGGLLQGSNGSFYGTTDEGTGTVFTITPAGDETVLYSFPEPGSNGSIPSSLVQGTDGDFYGTTDIGGSSTYGTIFQITPAGTETVLHSFNGGTDGELPSAALVVGSDGNFYGTTPFGGLSANPAPICDRGCGTVFMITPTGVETVLYAFAGGTADGANPYGALIQASDGNFYGTTGSGGMANCGVGCGTVFKITPTGVETVLYAFAGGNTDGASPSSVVQGSDGNFYGTTAAGGEFNAGTVFKITPAGVETVLHSFGGATTP
ncbi:MAG: choice-of-anchor tandem repeat GloVer-containing protein [Steroidobacteraceae bacterium]